MSTLGAIGALGAAIYLAGNSHLLNSTISNTYRAAQNVFKTLITGLSDKFSCYQRYREKEIEDEVLREEQKERDDVEAEEAKIEVEMRREKDRIEFEKLWRKLLGQTANLHSLEKNCAPLPSDYKQMSDLVRVTDPRFNPMCCNHAKAIFTLKGENLFSSFAKIKSQFRKLSLSIHPDRNENLQDIAKLAMQKLGNAKETLKLCLPQRI